MKNFKLTYVCDNFEIDEQSILQWIECQLITPIDPIGPTFDQEDLSRIKLIIEIKKLYQTNNDSMQVILNLIDQIHLLRRQINQRDNSSINHQKSA